VTPEQARLELFGACDDVRASGSGIRNATLNRRAEWVGRLIGSGLLAEREATDELKRAGRDAGLTPAEIRATLSSALRSGKARPIEIMKQEQRAEPIPQSRFAPMAEWLLEQCALEHQQDVVEMLKSRRLYDPFNPDLTADVFALPADQEPLVSALVSKFGRDDLTNSGLAHQLPSGELDVSRFAWPQHRLCITWRDGDGDAQTIERRHVGSGHTDKRWVFPRQRAPWWPLGWDELSRALPERAVVIVEGPTDWIAVRAWLRTELHESIRPVVIALPSATKLRPEWLRLLSGRRVAVNLDADKAGAEASAAIIDQLVGIASQVTRKVAPAKDWAEAWQKRCARG
jgi:hypothetical protein